MNSPKWKLFERIVAAIHIARSKGAKVTWNEEIDGRQFDVVVRLNDGVYDYLTLIECKRFSSPVPVEKVEAFATKSRMAKANKAVLISSSGFQSGCIKVAKEYGISLITLTERMDFTPQSEGRRVLLWKLFDVILEMSDGSRWVFPELNGRLEYLLQFTLVKKNDGRVRSLISLIDAYLSSETKIKDGKGRGFGLNLAECKITVPQEFTDVPATAIYFSASAVEEFIPKNQPLLDRSQYEKMALKYYLFDELTKKEIAIDALELPLGFDTELIPGKFYSNPNLGSNYYVEKIVEGKAWIWQVESYVRGNLFQTYFLQDLKHQNQYVEITHIHDLIRLEWMYRDLLKSSAT